MKKNPDFNRALRSRLASLKESTALGAEAIEANATSLDVLVQYIGDREATVAPYLTLVIDKRTRAILAHCYSVHVLSAESIASLLMRCATELGISASKEQ